jgi:hypothetical protein
VDHARSQHPNAPPLRRDLLASLELTSSIRQPLDVAWGKADRRYRSDESMAHIDQPKEVTPPRPRPTRRIDWSAETKVHRPTSTTQVGVWGSWRRSK